MSTMHQKPNEAGWFYHAPARKVENPQQVGAPPPSQIPGLGDIAVLPPEKPKEMVFRDTDSKYIRMAKMGGRKDLLTIRPNSGTKREPKQYHRNDWYYLEDNAQEEKAQETAKKPAWKFLLPEYMVHQSYGQTTLPEESPRVKKAVGLSQRTARNQAQSSSKGQLMTDKIVKSPKASLVGNRHRVGAAVDDRTKPLCSKTLDESTQLKFQPLPEEPGESTSMAKLLSYSYEREWHDRLHKWQEKQTLVHQASQEEAKKTGCAKRMTSKRY